VYSLILGQKSAALQITLAMFYGLIPLVALPGDLFTARSNVSIYSTLLKPVTNGDLQFLILV